MAGTGRFVPASSLAVGDLIARHGRFYTVELVGRVQFGEYAGRVHLKAGDRTLMLRADDPVDLLVPASTVEQSSAA